MDNPLKIFYIITFTLLMALILWANAFGLDSVRIVPLDGPIGTAQIDPANGSATAYKMDFRGQKTICFISASDTDVYIGSHSAITTTGDMGGIPLYNKGDNICLDLKGGTTVYFYGDGASADVRAITSR